MYISARLDKSTKVTNHITTTLLPSTHFAVGGNVGAGAEGANQEIS